MAADHLIEHELVEKIYDSSSCTVYRGTYKGAAAVFKRLKREFCTVKNLSRFKFEYDIGIELNSNYILRPIASIEIDGAPCHVFSDDRATSLADYLRSGPLKIADAIKIGIEVTQGLDHLHSKKNCSQGHQSKQHSN